MSIPYIALYPGDFLADTGHLGNTELGIYWRLLLVYYRDARPLPVDMDRLRRLAMTFSPEECRALESVLPEFFILTSNPDGSRCWRHKRADIELSRATSAHTKKSEAAKATNAKRWGRGSLSESPSESLSDIAKRPKSDGEPEPEPEPQIQTTSVVKGKPSTQAECPHSEILKLWGQHMPAARQPAEWTPARQTLLRTRWRESPKRQNLEWWARFFGYVAKSEFLTGQVSTPGRKPFEISLDWLLKSEHFLKTIEGGYHNEVAA